MAVRWAIKNKMLLVLQDRHIGILLCHMPHVAPHLESDQRYFAVFDRNPVCLMSLALLRQLCQHATPRVSVTYRQHSRTVTYFSSSRRYRACGNSSLSIQSALSKASTRSSSSPFRKAAATVGVASTHPASVALQDDEPLEWDEEAPAPEAESEGVLVLPPPSHSRVKTADFVKSSTAVSQCPPAKHPEFAVIGRSNVGKSSLINMLTGRKALAQISKTPGRHFPML